MDKIVKFFRSTWNVLISLAATLSAVIAGFIVPPKFATQLVEATIDYSVFSKFILCVVVTLFLSPALCFTNKRYRWRWWIVSFVFLIAGFFAFRQYYTFINKKTAIYNEQRVVVGDTLVPAALEQVQKYEKDNGGFSLTNEEIIANASGAIHDLWTLADRQRNSLTIISAYLCALILFAIAAMSAIQALYCVAKGDDLETVG